MRWVLSAASSSRKLYRRNRLTRARPTLEILEDRRLLSTSVTRYHYDNQSTGADLTETQLTSSNVNSSSFGKLYSTSVDGQVYAEPLVLTNVTITGNNAGTYDSVVFVATQNDSLYAINTASGAVLWQRVFLDTTNSNDHLAGATSVTTVSSSDVNSNDINPKIGITGTPVIDPSTNILYLDVKTKETVGGTTYFVQRVHAISIANGTDAANAYVLGTTTNGNTNNTSIYVNGTGAGSVGGVVQFNALREANRPGLSLANGTVYLEWASHGDNGPYHGWVVTLNISNLSTQGMVLSGVLNTDPNGSGAGIWGGGGGITFEPDNSAFYFETGNGFGRGSNPPLDANGFPTDHSYYESLVKVVTDPTTTATNQNSNGWGLKITDYFTPYNVVALDNADEDFGSGSPLVLPASAGIPNHPNLMVAAGKEGKIYLLDRNSLGKFNSTRDNVINAVPNGSGQNTAPVLLNGSLSTPAYYHGELYWVSGYNNHAQAYLIASNGTIQPLSESANTNFGYLPGSVVVSANGSEAPGGGIVWVMDTANNELHAYSSLTLNTELWNSNDKAGDALGSALKFAVPTVANGQVFVGTSNSLMVYGLTGAGAPAQAPNAPANLSAQALSGSAVELNWTDSSVSPNFASNYVIQDSTNNVNFATVANAGQQSTSYTVTGLSPSTTYYFRIAGSNSAGTSAYSGVANTTTTAQTGTTPTAPVGLSGTPAGPSSVYLNWNNTASNETGFTVTRATDTNFTQNVVTETLAAAPFYYTDTAAGMSPGNTYYYRIRATNSSGSSSSSNTAGVNVPALPPQPTNATAVQNNAEIDVSFVDHAGPFALGYQIFRSVNGGAYTLYLNLPETSDSPPSTQSFADTNVSVNNTYSYQIEAHNVSGFSAAATASATVTGPAAPSGLTAVLATGPSVNLNWTNNATNQTSFKLDRATNSTFTANLITQVLPATPFSFTDTAAGLTPGNTYYYRIRASNSLGDSANSTPPASVSIAPRPAAPTNVIVANVTTGEVDLSWTDNAGQNASYYDIQRAVGNNSFTDYMHLPASNNAPPSTYTWSDTGLAAGTSYAYEVETVNNSGTNGFVTVSAVTLTTPPTGLIATGGVGVVNLSWTAPLLGTQSYRVYRGTSPGGEGATPLVTGLTGTTYADTTVASGVTYYYIVTSVNANVSTVPAIPYESAASNEVSGVSRYFSHFAVSAGATASAGTSISFTVTAQDQLNATFPSYNGAVHFTSTDGAASLPHDATLTNGLGTFSATLRSPGNQWITASDSVNIGETGTSAAIAVGVGAAFKLVFLTQPSNTVAGMLISPPVQVAVEDSLGHVVTTDNSTITVALGLNPGGGTLSGTLSLAASNGVAAFSNLSINQSGTGYTLTAADGGLTGATSNSFNLLVPPATQVVFTTQPTSTTAGLTLAPAVQVAVEDQFGHVVSTDTSSVTLALGANPGASTLSGTLTVAAVNGVATFSSLSLNQGGTGYTLTAADGSLTTATSSTFNIAQAVVDHLALTVPANATAGSPFLVTVTAQDTLNRTVVSYNGTVQFTSTDLKVPSPAANITLVGGVGYAVATLGTVGSPTITASDTKTPSITGTSSSIVIGPGAATHLMVSGTPSTIITGSNASFTVSTLDAFNNIATGYIGAVSFTSTDTAAAFAPSSYSFVAGDAGVHTFSSNPTFNTPGSQTITATDTANSAMTGTSSAIAVRGLMVQSVTLKPYGFVVTFNKGFNTSSLSLYGTGATPADVVLVGATAGIGGGPGVLPNASIVLSTTTNTLTWIYTYGMLPDDSYTLTLVSGSSGFKDLSGVPLDGNNSGVPGTNYTTTFSTSYNATNVGLVIPSFARGPGQSVNLVVPGSSPSVYYGGLPIQLTDGNNATTASFSITYISAMLTVTGATVDPHAPAGSTFTQTSHTVIGGFATDAFTFNTNSSQTLGTGTGPVTLGELTASIPNANGQTIYKSKRLLTFTSVSVNGHLPVLGVSGLEVVAYPADASGDGAYAGNDAALVGRVAGGQDSGFAAYRLVDPVLIADIAGEGSVTANDASQVAQTAVHRTVPNLQPIPTTAQVLPTSAPDPTLSLPASLTAGPAGIVTVPVNLDDARPAGSTGLTEATLALRFDPRQFTVSATDIRLGTLPLAGNGWTLTSSVDSVTGQVGITLYSLTPLTMSAGGSLVIIDFHERQPGVLGGAAAFRLVDSVNPNQQGAYRTNAADANGALMLSGVPSTESIIGKNEPLVPGPAYAPVQVAAASTASVGAREALRPAEGTTEVLAAASGSESAAAASSDQGGSRPSSVAEDGEVNRSARFGAMQAATSTLTLSASLSSLATTWPGVVLPPTAVVLANSSSVLPNLEQHSADRWFLALVRGVSEVAEPTLGGSVPLISQDRGSSGLDEAWDNALPALYGQSWGLGDVGTAWRQVLEASVAAPAWRGRQEYQGTAPVTNPPVVDVDTLTAYFARAGQDGDDQADQE
jgi:fibronectin type 3 domain-containing protein